MSTLADELELPCGARLPNRIAKAAMSEQLAEAGGRPGRGMVRLYRRWAEGGVGLSITGHVMIDGRHLGEPRNVIIESRHELEALRRLAEAGQAGGGAIWAQLNHPGRQAPRNLDPRPVAPSAVAMRIGGGAFAPPRALRSEEIEDIVARFARSAEICEAAGFDGVQIHGAHGYLVSQFLSPLTNKRRDDWGGDAKARRRFLLEILRAVRGAVSPGFAVGLKLNSADFQRGGFDEDESMAVVEALTGSGLDLLEISGGTYERAEMFDARSSTGRREAYFLDYAEKVRARATMPLMLTGGFRSRRGMDEALQSGAVDVVGMARPLSLEPDLPRRLLSGEAEAARPFDISTPFSAINSMLPSVWCQQQLHRMAEGRDPDPELSPWRSLLRYGKDAIVQGRRVRRRGLSS